MTRRGSPDRVGVLGLWHETNTYSGRVPGLADFIDYELLRGDEIAGKHRGVRSVIGGFLETLGARAVPLFSAGAWPAAPASRMTLDALLAQAREALELSGPLDGVLLNLHGAMVAEATPDVEVEVVRLVREIHGALPVVAVLDLHGNPSVELAAAADVLLSYDTYPHVDMWERGAEAAGLMQQAVAGTCLVTAIAKRPLLTCPLAQGTNDEPMSSLMAWAKQRGRDAGALRVSLLPGFAYSDVERAGFSVLVVDTAARATVAQELAAEIAAKVVATSTSASFVVERPGPAEAVRQAMNASAWPVVLVDVADNIGGGSAGDGTVLLAELLRQAANGAVVVLADARVALAAAAAGPGGTIRTVVGGKTDALHGDPVPVEGTVVRVTDGSYTAEGTWATGQTFCMGTTAVLDLGGVTIVVTERATPPFHAEQLTSVGIRPAEAKILVAKGAIAWKAAYGDVARQVIEVDAPGACPLDPWILPRTTTPTAC